MAEDEHQLERLAVKSLFAAEILHETLNIAKKLQKAQQTVLRNIQQLNLVLTWRQGCGAFRMVGSASKITGGLLVATATMYPKLSIAVNAGHGLWKLGTSLKVLSAIGHMVRDLWQSGLRNNLMEFVHSTALLTRNLSVINELILDIQGAIQSTNSIETQSAESLIDSLTQFTPSDQIDYMKHIIHMALGNKSYSPLRDFTLMSAHPNNKSNMLQLLSEIASFNFTEFVGIENSKTLIAIGNFLHLSHELLDFLDGFVMLTKQDCRFMSECLTSFMQKFVQIMSVVKLLNNIRQFL